MFHTTTRTSDPNDIYSYGFAFTSGDLDDAVKKLADLLPDLLRLAECEKSCQLMAAEIEKTRRRVNALEHVVIPETRQNIRYITMKLDENERSSQTRLMKVKDMMLESAHHYSEKALEREGRSSGGGAERRTLKKRQTKTEAQKLPERAALRLCFYGNFVSVKSKCSGRIISGQGLTAPVSQRQDTARPPPRPRRRDRPCPRISWLPFPMATPTAQNSSMGMSTAASPKAMVSEMWAPR